MQGVIDVLQPILTCPTPEALVSLQGALLASGQQGESLDRALAVAGHFHEYLSELQSKITARQYSELASLLDIGAVGAVAFESLLSAQKEDFWLRLILGGIAEGLMVAASRQYVKAWTVETDVVHSRAAWYLAEVLWHVSSEMQPDLAPEQRWEGIRSLLAPAYTADVPAPERAVLLGRVFQILLLTNLAGLLPDS